MSLEALLLLLNFIFIVVNNDLLVSGIQHSDSKIYMYILFKFLSIVSLLKDTEYSSLCYIVGPCWYAIVYIC